MSHLYEPFPAIYPYAIRPQFGQRRLLKPPWNDTKGISLQSVCPRNMELKKSPQYYPTSENETWYLSHLSVLLRARKEVQTNEGGGPEQCPLEPSLQGASEALLHVDTTERQPNKHTGINAIFEDKKTRNCQIVRKRKDGNWKQPWRHATFRDTYIASRHSRYSTPTLATPTDNSNSEATNAQTSP